VNNGANMWLYEEKELDNELVSQYYGFIYCIQNTLSGKQYIGRKYFTKASSKVVKGKRKKTRKESDWKDYWGSSAKLLQEIETIEKHNFTRKIIRLCKTRGECNYWEAKIQFELDVLTAITESGEPAFYNDNIMMKFTRKNIGLRNE
jgi:hypothetical protein